jgi:hypothetical protein
VGPRVSDGRPNHDRRRRAVHRGCVTTKPGISTRDDLGVIRPCRPSALTGQTDGGEDRLIMGSEEAER